MAGIVTRCISEIAAKLYETTKTRRKQFYVEGYQVKDTERGRHYYTAVSPLSVRMCSHDYLRDRSPRNVLLMNYFNILHAVSVIKARAAHGRPNLHQPRRFN